MARVEPYRSLSDWAALDSMKACIPSYTHPTLSSADAVAAQRATM